MKKVLLSIAILSLVAFSGYSQVSIYTGLNLGSQFNSFSTDVQSEKINPVIGLGIGATALKHNFGLKAVFMGFDMEDASNPDSIRSIDASYLGAELHYTYRYVKTPVFYMGIGASVTYAYNVKSAVESQGQNVDVQENITRISALPSFGISVPMLEIELRPEVVSNSGLSKDFENSLLFVPTLEIRYKFL